MIQTKIDNYIKQDKYQNAKIYKITDRTNENIYIGSTCKSLEHRLKDHQAHYKYYQNNGKKYISSIEIIKNGDYIIELL